jgi:hypothetical protein
LVTVGFDVQHDISIITSSNEENTLRATHTKNLPH